MQCLFDWKLFYNHSGHLYFPAKLCFPNYFAFSVYSILQQISTLNKNILNEYVLHVLPTIIKNIFNNDDISLNYKKLLNIKPNGNIDMLFLETYLNDKQSIYNYQMALMNELLTYHKVKSISDIVDLLHKKQCCQNKLDIHENPPHSKHYLTLTNDNNSTCNKIGPSMWGPFYWNVFHTLAENYNDTDVDVLKNFIYILPFLVPCTICSNHYLENINFENFENHYGNNIKLLYNEIHNKVSDKLKYQ